MAFFEGKEIPHITDKAFEFDFDPDTGLVSLVFLAGQFHPSMGDFEIRNRVMLTPKASQALLADLPRLEAVLLQAAKGPTKPRAVQ